MTPAEPSHRAFQFRAARNHIDWFTKQSRASGMPSGTTAGASWAVEEGEANLLFPQFTGGEARLSIDEIVTNWRANPAISRAGCWSLLPTSPPALGALLFARGWAAGWQPWWMRLDLAEWSPGDTHIPGIEVGASDDLGEPVASNLPYHDSVSTAGQERLAQLDSVHFVTARRAGKLVGKIAVSICKEERSAGLYGTGVAPRWRNRGIGAALTTAACLIAAESGCDDVLLNATAMGAPVYHRVGFEHIGEGQTWWLPADRLHTAPDAAEVLFVEALGRGDTAAAEAFLPEDLDAPLLCGLTPVETAVRCAQPASVQWFVTRGATLDLISCWDIGWKQRAADLASQQPALLTLKRGEAGGTPLHTAVARGDMTLLQMLLAANPNLDVTDDLHESTALGWAEFMGRTQAAALLRAASETAALARGLPET
jgi:N-acetylglutamate synthase-like GNAT family acetyltransferase